MKVSKFYKTETMGLIVRAEPIGEKFMEGQPQLKQTLQKTGWLKFIEIFYGYHKEITKSFARSFDATEVEIGDIKFVVTKYYIAEATELPRLGERWFKNKKFHSEYWKVILRNPGMDVTVFEKEFLFQHSRTNGVICY